MSSLELRGINKTYGAVHAVREATLQIEEGELVAILGPSGCGKTTLLRMITGFLRPDSGAVVLGGEDVTLTPVHRRDIGMVYQNYALWPHMTVGENVAFGLEMRKIGRREREERVRAKLELVGLGALESRYPAQLSGGQQQRVALARALVIEPKVLLLDEPLASLDANLRLQLRFYIRELQQQLGVTTLFVTHDQEEALAVADRLVLMRDGVVVEMAPGEDLYRHPRTVFAMTFMGDANLLHGAIGEVDHERSRVQVTVPFGKVWCATTRVHGPGEQVVVGVRPDDVRLRVGDDGGVARGEVKNRIFLGPWARYEIAVGEVTLQVRIPQSGDEGNLTPGTVVVVDIPDGAPRVLEDT